MSDFGGISPKSDITHPTSNHSVRNDFTGFATAALWLDNQPSKAHNLS
jgi:hypothetical protein